MTGGRGRIRLAGTATGAMAYVGAWLTGAAIARLTGAAAVLLVLAATFVAFVAAIVSAWRSTARTSVTELSISPLTSVDTPTAVVLRVGGADLHRDGVIRLFDGRDELATVHFDAFDDSGRTHLEVSFAEPGVVTALRIEIATSGAAGTVWMRRTDRVEIASVWVAPIPRGPADVFDSAVSNVDGVVVTEHGPKHGEVDGIRTWRDGDGDSAVHWPSTLRAGALIVHDRQTSLDRRWIVDLPSASLDGEAAARFTFTLLDGLRLGHQVAVRRVVPGALRSNIDDIPEIAVTGADDARRWGAASIGDRDSKMSTPPRWHSRTLHCRARVDTFAGVGHASRWLTAACSLVALGMLVGALGAPLGTVALGAGGLLLGTLTSLRATSHDGKPRWLRALIGTATLGALGYIASTVGGVGGLLEALRGPMPDLLMLLLVIHGFEVVDRRTLRVHQAIGGVIVAYATGLRIDDRVGWWLAAWGVIVVAAVRATTRHNQPRPRASRRASRVARPLGAAGLAAAATLAVLSIVPVPDGPARLGLPALSNDAPAAPPAGGLAGPSGGPPAPSDGTRGALGQAGGYPGFTETMDTSVRGDLGDEIVMRVRAPQPAFWRGQTFSTFDGRLWIVDDDNGVRRNGPEIAVPATLGDLPQPGVAVENLVQTYYIEADLPNVVFAAARPDIVTFDGGVYTRPDGALRSDVTLTAGSVYTVVSQRVQVTSESLRSEGDVGQIFATVDGPVRARIDPYLDVPDSTTQRTIDLANSLRRASTYDTILAYQNWLALNTGYDLDAPIPAAGADAVDDFLFVSQRGFCEQIASSLAIMLRTQGVPTRVATGYIPGVRDKVSGVFEVRASDAHAWVEVWFPGSGWQAFDPTASVPLSGEAATGTVGGDLLSAAISGAASRPVEVGLLVAFGIAALGTIRAVADLVRRRRRGRWGVLQDRFVALADPAAITNPQRAATVDDPCAFDVARLLDDVAFDPDWTDDDADYARAASAIATLSRRRTP